MDGGDWLQLTHPRLYNIAVVSQPTCDDISSKYVQVSRADQGSQTERAIAITRASGRKHYEARGAIHRSVYTLFILG